MPKTLVVGAMGRMGQCVRAAIAESPQLELGAALEVRGHPSVGDSIAGAIKISDDPKAALSACEIAIDFTTPEATLEVMRAAAEAGVAYVCGTTGFSETQRAEIGDLAARIPIVHAPNFSVSVNILAWLTQEAARKLGSTTPTNATHRVEPRCTSPRRLQPGGARSSQTTLCSSARAIPAPDPRMRSASRRFAAETSRANTP